MTIATIQIRRDTAANWTSVNPTLASGEFGYETDTGKVKLGDGATAWASKTYLIDADLSDLISRWVAASASGPASLDFHEDTDNGSHRVRVSAPSAVTADRAVTLPDVDGTLVTLAGGTFTGDVSVPDEAYGAGWNASVEVPTKNAVYDKIEALSSVYVAQADLAYARKAAGEVVNNSSTFQDDDDLIFAIGANDVWHATYVLLYDSATAADIKFNLTVPSGCSYTMAVAGATASATSNTGSVKLTGSTTSTGVIGGAGVGTTMFCLLHVLIRNGATAGNVTLQWAQQTADATDTTLQADSFVTARKVA